MGTLLMTTMIQYGLIPENVLSELKTRGLITENQVRLHGSALPLPDPAELARIIEEVLAEKTPPEIVELSGTPGIVQIGWCRYKGWRSETQLRFIPPKEELDSPLLSSVIWITPTTREHLLLRDIETVTFMDRLLVQGLWSIDGERT